MNMERNILQENMRRFKTLNLTEQEAQPQTATSAGNLDIQKSWKY